LEIWGESISTIKDHKEQLITQILLWNNLCKQASREQSTDNEEASDGAKEKYFKDSITESPGMEFGL
jgi:hypothetical protein